MDIKAIRSKSDYDATLLEVERLAAADPDPESPEGHRLEVLGTLLSVYESDRFPISKPDPLVAIQHRMEEFGLRQRDLVAYIGSKSKVSEVLAGRRPLTLAMIRALSDRLDIPVEVLVRESQTLLQSEAEPKEIVPTYPLKDMRRLGWISDTLETIRIDPEGVTKRFLARLGNTPKPAVLLKTSYVTRMGGRIDDAALDAWVAEVLVRAGLRTSTSHREPEVDDEVIRSVLKLSTTDMGPARAREFIESLGIPVVILRHLPRTKLDGASLRTETGLPIIALTLRYDRLDNFWHTLMHELVHIWLHFDSKNCGFLDDLDIDEPRDSRELEADHVANDLAIPDQLWQRSRAFLTASQQDVVELAKQLEVHPAIVAGRLRRDRRNYKILTNLIGLHEVRALFSDF